MSMSDTSPPVERATARLIAGLAANLENLRPEMRNQAHVLLAGEANLPQLSEADRESYQLALARFAWLNDLTSLLQSSGVAHAYNFRAGYPQPPQVLTEQRVST